MKGLILKDLYMALKYGRLFLIITGFMLAVSVLVAESGFIFAFFPVLMCGAIIISLMAYDDMSRWSRYVGTLPCTRAQIVSARYITALILLGGTMVLVAIARIIAMLIHNCFSIGTLLEDMSVPFVIACFMTGVALPAMYRFGVEKSRLIYMLIVGGVSGFSAMLVHLMPSEMKQSEIPGSTLAIVCAVMAALFALSWLLSISVYKKKELTA